MFAASVPVVLQALGRAEAMLDKATPDMLDARLHPDMFDCADQFRTVASFALRATFPLTGRAMPVLKDEAPAAMLASARATVLTLTEEDFVGAAHRRVQHRAGFADLDQSAQDYLQHFALPNLWFHLAMAFAILRQQGATIGKADFDGMHVYPAGFTFSD